MYTMEGLIMKKQTYPSNTTTPTTSSSPLTLHRDSHMITKVKPTIRIIHIFAPEIIKTDVSNFRELVQRLTGKPSEKKKTRKEDFKKALMPRKLTMAKKMEIMRREKIKGEEEIWGGANTGGGFLGGFTELEGFMQEINQEFIPLIPNLDANSSHLDHPLERERLNLLAQ